MVHAFNHSTQEAKVDLWVQSQPGLWSQFQDSKGCTEKPCVSNKQTNTYTTTKNPKRQQNHIKWIQSLQYKWDLRLWWLIGEAELSCLLPHIGPGCFGGFCFSPLGDSPRKQILPSRSSWRVNKWTQKMSCWVLCSFASEQSQQQQHSQGQKVNPTRRSLSPQTRSSNSGKSYHSFLLAYLENLYFPCAYWLEHFFPTLMHPDS
jgi:hypothetical protein